MSSILHRNIIELLTEGQFDTVGVYFETQAERNSRAATVPQAAAPRAPSAPAWAEKQRANRSPAPWEVADMNAASFPFIENEIPAHIYTYKASKELAATLKNGDKVVVPAGSFGKMRVGTVWLVHKTPDIDFEAGIDYKWIVQKVDTTQFDDHMRKEAAFRSMLLEAKKAEERAAVRASVLASVQPGTEAYAVFQQALGVLGVAPPVVQVDPVAAPAAPKAS